LHPQKSEIISKRQEGIKRWHDSQTEEEKIVRAKTISQSKKGKSNGHLGFTHSLETKEKIRLSNILVDRSNNPEWREKHAISMEKRRGIPLAKKYKPVIIDEIEYPSVKDALIALGITHRAIFYKKIKEGKLKVIYK